MKNFKRVLAATDFSPAAARAAERAARLAREHAATLELLHVVDCRPLQALARFLPPHDVRTEADLVAAARRELQGFAEALEKRHGVRAVTGVYAGSPYREIVARADACHPDLVVIGAHGEHGTHMLSGATAQKVARAVRESVLVVRRQATGPYERILVPVDLAEGSRQSIEAASRVAPGASFYVLHAYEPVFEEKAYFADASPEALAHYRRAVEEGARTRVARLIADAALRNARVTPVLKRGHAPWVIERVTGELDAELIVMNARGRAELSRFFLGSVSYHTLTSTAADLLLWRASDGERERERRAR